MSIKPIVLTPGEPAGIGPELLLSLSSHPLKHPIVAITSQNLLAQRASETGIKTTFPLYQKNASSHPPISIIDTSLPAPSFAGKPDAKNSSFVLDTLKRATQGCLKKEFAALVTGPVNKAIINDAGLNFTGHTELLANLCGNKKTVMMLSNEHCRVALLTTHIPLSQVAAQVTPANLTQCLSIINQSLKNDFLIQSPRILVCGLNPHAGENGHIGDEEQKIMSPTLNLLRQQGMDLIGPVSADTTFIRAKEEHADVILTMYHDQGLPVIKTLGFSSTVNITLGLPIIRTSVDHGTAFDLAGSGKADNHSLLKAITTAQELSDKHL